MAVAVLMGSTGMMKAADGDTFTAKSTEGLQLTFKVISESVKTCQLGDGVDICIFEPYASSTREIKTLTIPEWLNRPTENAQISTPDRVIRMRRSSSPFSHLFIYVFFLLPAVPL